jgi:hypothetical protein
MTPMDMYLATQQPQVIHIVILGFIALALISKHF